MSNFRPRQCGLFIVILSSTLSLKTVVFLYICFVFYGHSLPVWNIVALRCAWMHFPMLLISDSALLPFSATGGGRKATSSPVIACLHKIEKTWYSRYQVFSMVRVTGLEPVRRETHAPQTCLSAYSSTLAFISHFFHEQYWLYGKTVILSILF